MSRIDPIRGSFISSGNRYTMRRDGSGRDPFCSSSNKDIVSHPLRFLLRTESPPTPRFSKGCSDCLTSCLSSCFPLNSVSNDQPRVDLAARKEEILSKVYAEFGEKKWSGNFRLMVEYDPIDNRLLFDGSILEYDESHNLRKMCRKVAQIIGCTENSDELQSDHLLSKHTRQALPIKGKKAACVLTDTELHTAKTNDSINIFNIDYGNVYLEEAYDRFMKRHIELVRKFFTDKTMEPQPKRKWRVLDLAIVLKQVGVELQ